jgi:small acid-soluble spore protein F (minor alpha/beta-type SASP)
MARKGQGIMSDQLKYELAQELGIAETVVSEGWGAVSSRDCGNLVKLAIARAERSLMQRQ